MLMDLLLQRLREPSTWAGIAALGAVLGIDEALVSYTGQVIMAIGGLAAIALSEKKKR